MTGASAPTAAFVQHDARMRPRALRRLALVTGFPFVASWVFLGAVPQLAATGDARAIAAIALGGVAAAELAAVGLVVRWLRADGRSLADLGWRRETTMVAVALALVVGGAYGASGLALGFIQHNAHPHLAGLSALRVWSLATAVAVIPACEEILFRGFAMEELRRAGFGTRGQLAISTIAFASFHGFFVLQAAVLGALFGAIRLLGRRSLTPVVAGHALVNLIAEPWFFLAIVAVQLR
jgi:membrane protease YdiL (CAAX protease family)